MVLTPKTTLPYFPQQICKRWELKDKQVYSGGEIRLDMAVEALGEVVKITEEMTTITERITMIAGMATVAEIGTMIVEWWQPPDPAGQP